MVHEGRIGAPSSTTFPSGAPHHPSPYHHGTRRRPSPPGSPAATTSGGNHRNCCFKPTPMMYREPLFCCCYNCPAPTSLFASLGICCLVIGYTLMGAFTFMTLEGGFTAGGTDTSSAVAASKSTTARIESILGADIRSRTVDKLWSITEDLNILYKENWTRLAAQEVMEFQDSLVRALRMSHSHSGYLTRQGGGTMFYHQSHRWTFSSSFLYSLTLITTIGYGSVSPHTPLGKLTTILYAVIGIPLMLVYLSTMGEVLARSFRHLYAKMCGVNMNNNMNTSGSGGNSGGCNRKSPASHPSTNPQSNHISPIDSKLSHYYKDNGTGVILNCGTDMLQTSNTTDSRSTPYKSRASGGSGGTSGGQMHSGGGGGSGNYPPYCGQVVSIPVSLCLLIIILYIIGGAILFNRLENWSLLEGSYFCFTSLGTIGFGDLVPGEHSTITDEISHCVCSIYILIGMALIAMCFNLVQDDIALIIRSMGRLCGGSGNNYRNSKHNSGNLLGHHRQDYNTSSQHFSHHYHHHAMDGCEEISMSVVS